MKITVRLGVTAALLSVCIGPSASVYAQAFPSKPIRIIVGANPGTPLDLGARLFGGEMSRRLGQPIVTETRPGAGSTIAGKAVASSPPDGYTLFYGNATSQHPVLVKENSLDATKDYAPISNMMVGAAVFYGRGSLPVRSLQDLVAYSKANPGKLTFGTPAPNYDLIMVMIKKSTGLEYLGIPYYKTQDSGPPLLAEEVDFVASSASKFTSQLPTGRVRALFATSRSSLLPDTPSLADLGLPGFEDAGVNWGLWAPNATPRNVIQVLNSAAIAAIKIPEISAKLVAATGYNPTGSTAEEQMRIYNASVGFLQEAARLANFQPQ